MYECFWLGPSSVCDF
ncbi:hypothetical protein PENCOP_c042G01983 [Penicillium coprophilum]|uniref:Uncharacterized protein n=1 Tax=Penicillium coprophilum TaxID=36646 RepID=A0A1V6U5I8_9EURO|nr:hypothetical protein PENCOP_c042G01983 [Penicillium coprophilum]